MTLKPPFPTQVEADVARSRESSNANYDTSDTRAAHIALDNLEATCKPMRLLCGTKADPTGKDAVRAYAHRLCERSWSMPADYVLYHNPAATLATSFHNAELYKYSKLNPPPLP